MVVVVSRPLRAATALSPILAPRPAGSRIGRA